MRTKLMSFAAGAILAAGAASPAAGAFTFNAGTTCTSGLEFCVNFQLQSGANNAFTLTVNYVSSAANPYGVISTVGLYGPNQSTSGSVTGFSGSATGSITWSNGTNKGEFVEANAPPPPSQTGATVGQTITISFTSASLAAFTGTVEARAHIITYGSNGAGGTCSMWIANANTTNGIKDGGSLDPACVIATDGGGGSDSTVPEPISMVLLGSGLLGIGGARFGRRRKRD